MSEHGQQLRIVEELWRQLSAIDSGRGRRVRRAAARRRAVRVVALVILVLLAAVALALAARALLFGAPAPQKLGIRGVGHFVPGSVRVLSLRVPDPGGGPPWGVRVATSTRRDACVQAGRIVSGRLVALGVAGSFADDGRAHVLPLNSENCGGLDDAGNARVGGSTGVTTTSATVGLPDCQTPEQSAIDRVNVRLTELELSHPAHRTANGLRKLRTFLRAARRRLAHPRHPCAPADLRSVLVGIVGPAAESVTLTGPGLRSPEVERTVPGDGGAYLFVLRGHMDLSRLRLTVRYRGGVTCPTAAAFAPARLTPRRTGACLVPPGYVYRRPRP
jgi:hypothetical protein